MFMQRMFKHWPSSIVELVAAGLRVQKDKKQPNISVTTSVISAFPIAIAKTEVTELFI